MPLVAAAVVPHAPVLVPAIAAGHAQLTESTRVAMQSIGAHAQAAGVETVIVITPHGPSVDERLTILTSDKVRPDLRTFGDVSAYPSWNTDLALAQQIRAIADEEHVPTAMVSTDLLDYGVAVPLIVTEWERHCSVIPIAIDHLSREMVIRVGHILNEAFHQSTRRIACIASADLAERAATSNDPDRPTPWERSIATAIRNGKAEELPDDDERSCGFSPIATLLSILHGTSATGEILNFQAPFRVGYLVADIHLHR